MGQTQAQQRPGANTGAQQGERGKAQPGSKPHKPQPVEWVVGGLSAALVVAMIGFILYQALGATTPKPELAVAVERIAAVPGGFRVEFRALNRGDATAAGVTVEGQLKRGDQTIETHEVTLDYVPAQSEHKGGLLFSHDPSQYRMQLEATGYKHP